MMTVWYYHLSRSTYTQCM